MPLRLPCHRLRLQPGGLLHSYFGVTGFHRPAIDIYLVGPGGKLLCEPAQIDTGSDYTIFAAGAAASLGLSLPFPRQVGISGAGGTYTAIVSFPPDGFVSLFVTDYHEYCYLPRPLIGFHAPGPSAGKQRAVLGLSGFLQYFRTVLEPAPPQVELHPTVPFTGSTGLLPLDRALTEFIASLRGAS